MRLVLACVLVSAIAGADTPKPTETWADWTGDYKGAVRWTGCTVTGSASPTLALEFTDGVASIDLAALRSGLPAVTLVEEETGWSARQGDLAFEIKRTKPDAIGISLEFETGCIARGTLTRAVTAVPACTKLASWARIETRCTQQSSKLEDASKLATIKWKPGDATQCTARADKLALAMIDVGCAPAPQRIGVRSKVCMDLAREAARLERCGNLSLKMKQGMRDMVQSVVSAAQTATAATLQYVEKQCTELLPMLQSIAGNAKCP